MATTRNGSASITVTTYAGSADVDLSGQFPPEYWRVRNPDSTLSVLVSFDGTTTHWTLPPNGNEVMPFRGEKKVWFKLSSSGTVAVTWTTAPAR